MPLSRPSSGCIHRACGISLFPVQWLLNVQKLIASNFGTLGSEMNLAAAEITIYQAVNWDLAGCSAFDFADTLLTAEMHANWLDQRQGSEIAPRLEFLSLAALSCKKIVHV